MSRPRLPLQQALLDLISGTQNPTLGDRDRGLGVSVASVRERLQAVEGLQDASPRVRALVECLVLLWFDHLDASHAISQAIDDPEGSYAHGMMHRREGDYWNSQYWMRRASAFEGWEALGEAMVDAWERAFPERPTPIWLADGRLDGAGFVDACEKAHKIGGEEALGIRALQQAEFEAFLVWLGEPSR